MAPMSPRSAGRNQAMSSVGTLMAALEVQTAPNGPISAHLLRRQRCLARVAFASAQCP